jgi:prolyl-tRNA synthetase
LYEKSNILFNFMHDHGKIYGKTIEKYTMRLSQFLLPTLKDNPSEAQVASHRLMLRAGMIRQVAAGIYNWLPLGLKILKKVEQIVREEMNAVGALEILMPCIQPTSLWEKSGRLGTGELGPEMLLMRDRHSVQMVFTPTAEEVISELFSQNVQSYKELPMNLYQIQWKFRDEIRPRFGLMRGREFYMKDSYSFHMNQDCALNTYEKMMRVYLKAFKRMGLTAIPVAADSGDIGGDYSHELHVLADTGESNIFFEPGLEKQIDPDNFSLADLRKFYAVEEEKYDEATCPIAKDKLEVKRGIEIGQVFYIGDKYSKSMDIKVQDKDGGFKHPLMGCYGIGVSRIVAAIIEASHDDNGIIWPEGVAPFKVAILNLKPGHEACDALAEECYAKLSQAGIEALYDDTKSSAGEKFAKADLIGIPYHIVIGPKLAGESQVELKSRASGERQTIGLAEAIARVSA